MKKLISILTTCVVASALFVTPVFGDTTSPSGVKIQSNADQIVSKALQAALKKAQDQLNKLTQEQAKLESTITSAIEKAKKNAVDKQNNAANQIANGASQQEKWKEALDKAAENDKQELDNLNSEIQKWTDSKQKQLDLLTKQISDIDTALTKQLAELDKKLAAAKDDTTKQNLTSAKTNVQNYAAQKKAAISTYINSLQSVFGDRQKIWAERKDLLTKRQAADLAFRTAMTTIKSTELNDKLAPLSQTQIISDADITATVRAKYQKTIDALNTQVTQLNTLIKDIQSKLNK